MTIMDDLEIEAVLTNLILLSGSFILQTSA